MDTQESHLPPRISSTSAVDLTGTPAGLANSVPPSPSDRPNTFARRRLSWGRVDAGKDPLRSQAPLVATFSDLDRTTSDRDRIANALSDVDEPFYPPIGTSGHALGYSYGSVGSRFESEPDVDTYQTAQAGPSSTSLIRHEVGETADDDACLTSAMTLEIPTSGGWDQYTDAEHTAASSHSSRRRTVQYSAPPSPLKMTGTVFKNVSRSLRRISSRVVNLGGAGLESQVRLPDDDDAVSPSNGTGDDGESLDMSQTLPIRGRTLGFLGPTNSLRLVLFRCLVHPWTEPVILVLIIVNAVVLTIQAAPTLTLPTDASGNLLPPASVLGYFQTWEDYVLFGLFVLFSLEAFARICVSGFLLDPEVPISTLFTSPLSSYPDIPPGSSINISSAPSLQAPLSAEAPLSRGLSFTQRLNILNRNFSRPFALANTSRFTSQSYDETLGNGRSEANPNMPISEKTLAAGHHLHSFSRDLSHPSHLSNVPKPDFLSLPFRLSVTHANDKTRRNIPYLRHSWGRIDFIAIMCFWITFALATTGVERGSHHIGVFRALSVLRTARLLTITSGTTTIMHSLKTARPLLASVAYFVLFAMVLFSIIGVSAFKGALRRTCYISPTLGEAEVQLPNQSCGGHIDPVSLNETGYIALSGSPTASKGYICPLGSVCMEEQNPFNNVQSFDTIYYSTLQVIIVASTNGWSTLMYSTMESEYFVSCLFFIICVIVLNFWLINLFVAVITNTFSAIRSNTKKSAFGAAPLTSVIDDHGEGWAAIDGGKVVKTNPLKKFYEYTRWFWVILALASVVLQATRTVDVGPIHQLVLDNGELIITLAFDIEIIWRILATLPNWRSFFDHGNNLIDLVLALVSSIIQLPAIHRSQVYPWFTIFQLARFYRVILEVPGMRPLVLSVFGNMYGLVNMTLFLLLVNYIAALASVQLMRGDIASSQPMNFGQLFTAFLAIYQICSSENWTNVLYDATAAEIPLGQTIIVATFLSCWMLFANFIVLQMFIAVINENFQIAEEAKRSEQASKYWATYQAEAEKAPWIRRLNPYRWFKANPVKVKVENLPSNLVLPIRKALVQDYAVPRQEDRSEPNWSSISSSQRGPGHYSSKSLKALERLFAGDPKSYDVPLTTLHHARNETTQDSNPIDEETERHLELLAAVNSEPAVNEDINDSLYEHRAQKADFIRDHPSFDKTFWLFSQRNPLRRLCQKLVQPAGGERIFGVPHSGIAHPIFQLFLLLAVIGGILVEGVATPLYRRHFYIEHGLIRGTWFTIAEVALGFTLLVEFFIKIIADGFIFTPNAYLRSIWNVLDFIILVGLLVNLTTALIFIGGLSRFTRSLKALRALRIITLLDRTRNTFESLIISGAARILGAAVLAILYMIPYAVWGLNIFAGVMNECNDSSASGASDCINEFDNTVYGTAFGFLSPRVWDNPAPSTTFSFDTFKASLLILFEIVSLEGWVDVMTVATSVVGPGQQPQTNNMQVNAIFFLIYNLLGGVVILTLFVSIIIGNFSSKTGSAFLTQSQREWIDLQKLIRRQRPSKRPQSRPTWPIRAWCFDRAVRKHGLWARMMTLLFVLHIVALMTQSFSVQKLFSSLRNDFFLVITFIYLIDVAVRFFGLGWRSFRANGWNIFDIIIAGGSFISTLIVRFGSSGSLIHILQKLFLVSIAFKLVERTNSLNKLFKTAISSLAVIANLLVLWFILSLFFAILYTEVFGLTKWHSAETSYVNYSSMGSSLLMLAFMSTGEAWNQYMHDYAIVYPRCTNPSPFEADSDCGSAEWAFSLFIAWNLLSMYIFTNMFTGVVVENFSYVFQATSRARSITREEIRSFKKIWGEFANPKTEYLERNQFVPFFSKLSGVFEVRIYPIQYSLPNIMAKARKADDSGHVRPSKGSGDIDLNKLHAILGTIDYASVRRRRVTYSRLYYEASISHQPGRGISFTDMLMLLAHHKIIVDREAMVLNDLVARTETNKLVTDLVNLDRVRSLLKMISLRRRFLAHREQMRAEKMNPPDIPTIVVDVLPSTPRISTRAINTGHDEGSVAFEPSMPSPTHWGPQSPLGSFSPDLSGGSSLQRSRRTSDMSMLSTTDNGSRLSEQFSMEDDAQQVLADMQHSMWGEMMLEAAASEEEA